jgi:hypothetical protein
VKYNGFNTLKEALDAHRVWITDPSKGKYANLSCMDLYGADLYGADLYDGDLSGADLRDADLGDADLSYADLRGADLSYADLRGANLGYANLNGANFRGANLRGAYLRGADLRGATLPAGYKWEQYLAEVVPALLTAGGKTLEEVATGWDCHNWQNCPIHIAFDAPDLNHVPALYRREAEQFIQLFDAKLIPYPMGLG